MKGLGCVSLTRSITASQISHPIPQQHRDRGTTAGAFGNIYCRERFVKTKIARLGRETALEGARGQYVGKGRPGVYCFS